MRPAGVVSAVNTALPANLRDVSFFLVWGPESHGPRSRVFARELGIDAVFVVSTLRRGLLTAPFKYASQAVKTVRLLLRRRPRLVFVQSPPTFAALLVAMWGSVTGTRLVIDAHSAAMLSPVWTRPRWLHRGLSRIALATVVTDEHFARRVEASGGRALVIRDIPTVFPTGVDVGLVDAFNVMVVNTFAPDEPLAEILAAARDLPGVRFHVTGDVGRARNIPSDLPDNVRFTGYLPDADYYGLMHASQVVMCLTTRNHTMQRGACEALSAGTPIVTSDWPLLRRYFDRGTVHVRPNAAAISGGVEEMRRHHARFASEIEELQIEQRNQWQAAVASLTDLIDGAVRAPNLSSEGRRGR